MLAGDLTRGTRCHARLNQHADVTLYASVPHAIASALPLARVNAVRSVRDSGFVNPKHVAWAREHLEAWAYVAFLHQSVASHGL